MSCDLIKDIDPVPERQSKVLIGLQDLMKVYKDEQRDQAAKAAKKRKQISMGDFFAKKPKN